MFECEMLITAIKSTSKNEQNVRPNNAKSLLLGLDGEMNDSSDNFRPSNAVGYEKAGVLKEDWPASPSYTPPQQRYSRVNDENEVRTLPRTPTYECDTFNEPASPSYKFTTTTDTIFNQMIGRRLDAKSHVNNRQSSPRYGFNNYQRIEGPRNFADSTKLKNRKDRLSLGKSRKRRRYCDDTSLEEEERSLQITKIREATQQQKELHKLNVEVAIAKKEYWRLKTERLKDDDDSSNS